METRDPCAGDFTEAFPCQVVVLYGIVYRKGVHVLLIQERDRVHEFLFGRADLFQVRDPLPVRRAHICRFFHGMEIPVIRSHAVIDVA